MQPLEVPMRLSEADHGKIGLAADIFGVVVQFLLALRIERGRMTEQHAVHADPLRLMRETHDVLDRVEAAMEQETMFALRLVYGDFHELDVFGVEGRGFRYQERAPKTELDIAPQVMADARLIQTLQIRAVARNDDVAEPMPRLPRPFLCLALLVFLRHRSVLRACSLTMKGRRSRTAFSPCMSTIPSRFSRARR